MADTTELIIKRQDLAAAEPAVGSSLPVPPSLSLSSSYSSPMSVNSRIKPEDMSRMRALGELLANAYHQGQFRKMPWPDNFNKETPEIRRAYREMLRDGSVRSAFYSKILSVSSLDLQVLPASESPADRRVADFLKWNYTRGCKGGFPKIARSILEGGCSEGYSLCEPVIDIQPRGEYRLRYTLQKFKAKDSKLYDLEVDNFDEIKAVYVKATNRRIRPDRFVIWSYLSMFENVIGSSDFRACYREFLIIDVAMKMAAIDVERFVLPMIVGNYDQSDQQALMEEAIRTARSLGFAALPKGATIQALQLATSGPDRIDSRLKMCQANIFMCITGASLQAMEGQKTGSLAMGRVHQNQSQLPIWFLATEVAEVLNWQVTPQLVNLNFGEEYDLPTVVVSGVDDAATKEHADLLERAQRMGMKPSRKDAAKRLGIQEAQSPEDELIPQSPGGPGAGGTQGSPDSLGDMGIFNQRRPRSSQYRSLTRISARNRCVRYSSVAVCGGDSESTEEDDGATAFAESTGAGGTLQSNLIAASGADERRILQLLATAREEGKALLLKLAREGLKQGLASRESANFIWTPDQLQELASYFTSLLTTGEMLGRARIRMRADQWIRRGRVVGFAEPTDFRDLGAGLSLLRSGGMPPAEEAINYFNRLVPSLNVVPDRVLPSLERASFTLAVGTNQQILKAVQSVIGQGLQTGRASGTQSQVIDDILKAVGLTPKSPQYAENVVRTNSMDAWNVGQDRERQTPEMMVAFPVWQYVGIADGRERSWHAVHFDKYFPAAMSFVQVRDSVKVSPWNCRCSQLPVDRNTWKMLQGDGAVMSFAQYRGAKPPGDLSRWKLVRTGPRGGKIWESVESEESNAENADSDNSSEPNIIEEFLVPSKATIGLQYLDSDILKENLEKLEIRKGDIPSLLGVPDGSRVTIVPVHPWESSQLGAEVMAKLEVLNEKYNGESRLCIDKQGVKFIYGDKFFADEKHQGSGIGTSVHVKQVAFCEKHGFGYLRCEAISRDDKGNPANGHYSWLRVGYDCNINLMRPEQQAEIKAHVPYAVTMQDVMDVKEARAWWKDNGWTIPVRFDIAKGSKSRKILEDYLQEMKMKGKKLSVNSERTKPDLTHQVPGACNMPLSDWEEELFEAAWERRKKREQEQQAKKQQES